MRKDGRNFDQLRRVQITPHVSPYAEGSCLVEFGNTKLLVTASYENQVPKWLQGSSSGWVTAEYGMLPRSTQSRLKREKSQSSGRTQEISRLIGRSLRAAVDLNLFPEKQITVDCDVLHADGGTRTAAITGGFVALALAFQKLLSVKEMKENPLKRYVAAVSVGLHKGQALLDLSYEEDSSIHTDMNFVMNQEFQYIEIQGTGEQSPFSRTELSVLLDVAEKGCSELFEIQAKYVGNFFPLKKSERVR